MSNRKGGYRRGGKQSLSSRENLEPPTTSAAAVSFSESIPDDGKSNQNRRNSRWGPRGRHPRTIKQQFVKKSEVGFSNRVEKRDEGEADSGEKGPGLKLEECNDEEVVQESGVNQEGKQVSDLDKAEDVQKRLEKLVLSAHEPKLSEEQLKINDQAQQDELLALESIYGDNIFFLDSQIGLRHFQIYVQAQMPREISVSTKLNSSGFLETESDSSEAFLYTFTVEYLSPIILECVLPKLYPSHIPPYFTISVKWLDVAKISTLCHMLDDIWNNQPGQEIIHQWVEWLHSSSLSSLGFDQEIILGPYGVKNDGDKRAISGSISANVDIPSMKSYNDEQRQENFFRNFHECCICFSEFVGTEFVRLPCQHFFCSTCMKTYVDMHVKEGSVSKLQCPEAKCGGMIPPGLLKRFLGEEEFKRWESMTLQKTLESMSDVTYCPRCETVCIEDGDNDAQCSKCFFSFCTLCREKRHVGEICMPPEMKLLILQKRQNSSVLNNDQRRREQEMINEILSVKEINQFAKQCPSCKMAISRTEGCNKMVCTNCGQYFCYRCNQAITGYDHFRDSNCELFQQQDIIAWEARMNARQVLGQINAEMYAGRGDTCPICRQPNAKVGNNNHIFCWACQNHYCYLCRKLVRRSSQHYGPKGCKQHTVE